MSLQKTHSEVTIFNKPELISLVSIGGQDILGKHISCKQGLKRPSLQKLVYTVDGRNSKQPRGMYKTL